jgi:tetratricopeptide (TPR) repeat protein
MAWILLFAGEYDRAIEQARATLDLYRDSIQAWYVLGLGQVARKKYEDAIDALHKAVHLSRDAVGIGYFGHACALAGREDQARALLGELLEKTKYDYVPPKSLVSLYGGLGEYDRAFECLEQAYQDQDSFLYWLRVVPVFGPLRADPRFHELSARIGLGSRT